MGARRASDRFAAPPRALYGRTHMTTPFHFEPVELPPETEALRQEARAFIAEELAAGRWQPNSDFGSHRAADFSRRLGERGWIGMTWPKQYGGGGGRFLGPPRRDRGM